MKATLCRQVVTILTTLILVAPWSAGACVVGSGTQASCTETALNACLPSGGSFDGTVAFDCGGTATIAVASTKIISLDTTIDGGGVITISGAATIQVFAVSSGKTFTVQNLTIANGGAPGGLGGAILNDGTLIVISTTFSGNSTSGGDGGAIFNRGTLEVSASTFSGNSAPNGAAGGIYNQGTLMVTNSAFSGNSTSNGGGGGAILNDGTVMVTNSTFSENSAENGGGGILNENGRTLTIANSTFSGNSTSIVGGAVLNGSGSVTVTNSTFSGNSAACGVCGGGGGLYSFSGPLTLVNTIVAHSTAGGNCAGNTIIDGGHNLDDDGSCGFSAGNASLSNTNARLDPAGLKNNGGSTQTIGLCTAPGRPVLCTGASPAIDAGNQAVCAASPVNNIDQRGLPRTFSTDPICDIGAFEVQRPGTPAPAASARGLIFLVVLLSSVGWLTLRRSAWCRSAVSRSACER